MPDPITVAVIRGALNQICDEMDIRTVRGAWSPIIAETNDMAHGIFHPVTGETIAQGRYGLPIFLAVMQFTVQNMLKIIEANGGFEEGDLWITNDPYIGGTHLQDIVLLRPYFWQGRLTAVLANTGHWMDVGGMTPGGWAPQATEVYQEGILIPPLRLYRRGQLDESALKVILANTRLPDQNRADLVSMANSLNMGAQQLGRLIAQYGLGTFEQCLSELVERSEHHMRSYIDEIPDGTYEFEDYLDNDGIDDRPLAIRVRVTVAGSDMFIDFTGTDRQCRGPLNISLNTTLSSCYVALKHVFPDVPVNGGTFRPIHITVPEGTILHATRPCAVGGYLEVVGRVIDVIFGALSKAIPARVPAACFGTTGVGIIAGTHPDTGKYYVAVLPYPGGYGATSTSDGLVHGNTPQSMANFMSVESAERRFPIRFDFLRVREGSGGAGFRRGGCGSAYGVTILGEEAVVSVLGDRRKFTPWGVHGGGPGEGNEVVFYLQGKPWRPPMATKADKVLLRRGDRVEFYTPGGGGYGDPRTREVERVEGDVLDGYIDVETAEKVYGVTLDRMPALMGWRDGLAGGTRVDGVALAAPAKGQRAGDAG